MTGGLTLVVPHGGRTRLPLLEATLRAVRRSQGDIQVVVAEIGSDACAHDAARAADADYVFARRDGPFVYDRARNLGAALALHDCIAWCDGDLVFAPDFLVRARDHFMASGCAMSLPYSQIDYLDAADTAAVLAGARDPAACVPLFVRRPADDSLSRHLYFVRRDFLERHGGMIEGFCGYGGEDCAFLHKVDLLGRRTAATLPDLRLWHLYHPDSGSIDYPKAARANPNRAANDALLARIRAIDSGETLQQLFPPPRHAPLPWPASARIAIATVGDSAALAARARDLSTHLDRLFGIAPATGGADAPTADLVVGFADTADGCAALLDARNGRPLVLLPGNAEPRALAWRKACWLVAADAQRAAQWRAAGAPVWHRRDRTDGAPTSLQPMAHLLGLPRDWRVRVTLARDALGAAAFDRSPFWYVAFDDIDGNEIARQDADRSELRALAAQPGGQIVLERRFASVRAPARWRINPVARDRTWLGTRSGTVDELQPD